jgi:chromosomal replication initiation ATPase DnaA
MTSHRGKTNSARDLALYLLRRYTRKTLTEIGRHYDIANYSTVSSAIVRAQKAIRENETVRRDYGEIENILRKRQSKT